LVDPVKKYLQWSLYLEIPTLPIGLFLFFASLRSGGTWFHLSGVFVPPLLLYIHGILPTGYFFPWLAIVAILQFICCLAVVYVVRTAQTAIARKP